MFFQSLKKSKKRVVVALFFLLILLILFEVGFLYFQYTFKGRVYPKTSLVSYDLSLKTKPELETLLKEITQRFSKHPLKLEYQGKAYAFSYEDFGIQMKTAEDLLKEIPIMKFPPNPQDFLKYFFASTQISPLKKITVEKWEKRLTEKIQGLKMRAHDAYFDFDELWELQIIPESYGVSINRTKLYNDIQKHAQSLSTKAIPVEWEILVPRITASELEKYKTVLKQQLSTKVEIMYQENIWPIAVYEHLDAVQFELQEYMYLGKMKLPVNFGKQESIFDSFSPIKTELIPSIVLDIKLILEGRLSDLTGQVEITSQDLVISKNENGKIIFNGTAKNGRMIDRDKLTAALKRAFANGGGKVELPMKEIKAKIDAPADLKSMGIQEIVAEGYSNFFGSPPNRIHNINVAMQAFDGLLVAPGAEFSFGENLGEVNEETGYKKELVIKEGKTIPDYGGGVCQVSSTLFRAAFFGGFPITDRKPHSYAVAYYARPLGFGLDATVYPPYVDLKFRNDTNQHILIQAYTEGYDAYFKFYGTRDERVVTWEGPYIENKTEPPADIITYTDQLPPGEKKKIDSAHEGFDATWYRTVAKTADEENKTEKFFSRYQAWPNKYMVGQEPAEAQKLQ